MDLRENFTTDVSANKEDLIKFSKLSASESESESESRNFKTF